MTDWKPIRTAPKELDSKPFLCWARWSWDTYSEDCSPHYSARVVKPKIRDRWDYGASDYIEFIDYVSITSNPYCDVAVHPTYWATLEEPTW